MKEFTQKFTILKYFVSWIQICKINFIPDETYIEYNLQFFMKTSSTELAGSQLIDIKHVENWECN